VSPTFTGSAALAVGTKAPTLSTIANVIDRMQSIAIVSGSRNWTLE
jgi:hypothetical protein